MYTRLFLFIHSLQRINEISSLLNENQINY